jgi:serine/threonine protein kinase
MSTETFPTIRPSEVSAFDQLTTAKQSIKAMPAKRTRSNRLFAITQDIVNTYRLCNPDFRVVETLPQRILTNPSEGVLNNGRDNEDSNLICKVHDTFKHNDCTFTILDLLGTGTFGQVFRCHRSDTKEVVAVKVVKNKPAYHTQGMLEIKVAKLLNSTYDPNDDKHIVRLLDSFEFLGHVCLVFELLSVSLLDLLTQNQFRGLPLSLVQRFTRQILTAMVTLEEANIIHCDLKPENILIVPTKPLKSIPTEGPPPPPSQQQQPPNAPAPALAQVVPSTTSIEADAGPAAHNSATNAAGTEAPSAAAAAASHSKVPTSPTSSGKSSSTNLSDVKVIDFGSACFEGKTVYSYIQSRFCKYFKIVYCIDARFCFSSSSVFFLRSLISFTLRMLSSRHAMEQTAPPKCCWAYPTTEPSTCGPWRACVPRCSWGFPCSRVCPSTTS